jgi:hypothetical protein
MDCIACGKPISITAKFCGKCGAPVKRSAKPAEEPVANNLDSEPTQVLAYQDIENGQVDEMTFKLSPPDLMPDLREINLELPVQVTEPFVAPPVPMPTHTAAPLVKDNVTPSDTESLQSLQSLEQTQQEIKKTLEKHSLLLDFISLTSQQQSHLQTQPNPLESLVTQVAQQQTSLQSQLTQLAALISQTEVKQHNQRLPDEFKLQLEKQKIEIHKLMAQSLGQNNENLKDDQHEVIEHLEKHIEAYHQAAQLSLEKNMGALAAGMSELKSQMQSVQKKMVEKTPTKSTSAAASDGDSFMIFIIGLLCGLTVVISSLAIYNFLSHETQKNESPMKTEAADKHAAPAEEKPAPAADKPGEADKHEAPAKDKSH